MVKYKNFLPREVKPAGIFASAHYEALDEVVEEVNAWLEENQVDVINIETVLQPTGEESADDALLKSQTQKEMFGGRTGYWFQFLRVWYRAQDQ